MMGTDTIANDWEIKSLGEVAFFFNGKAFKQEELLEKGKYKVLRVGNFFTKSEWYYSDLELEENKYVNNGDLMYAWSASFGPKYWVGEKTIFHYHIWKVIPSDLITKEFLYYILLFDTQRLLDNKQGGTMFHITKGDIEKRKVKLPDKFQQKWITNILGKIDDLIEKNIATLDRKKVRKQWLMQQLLTDKKRLKGFDNPWKVKALSDLLIPITRMVPKPDQTFLALGVRSHGKGTFLKYGFDPTKIEMENLFEVKENDLIVSITFAWEHAVAIAGKEDDGALVSHRFPTFTFNKENAEINFFRHYILQKRFKYLLELISPGGAGRNRVLSKKDFLKLEVKIPSITEQTAIANILETADKEIKLLEEKVEKLKDQKKGLMQVLLTGKKRLK
jgi:type I restriction enzyme S subunit